MSRRKGWEQLSETYRNRLERNGVRRSDYEGNMPLDVARGHAETPEHGMSDAIKDPDRWHDWIQDHKEKLNESHLRKLHGWLRGNTWPMWAYPKNDWSFLFYRK